MFIVYILKSLEKDRYYIGHCNDLSVRLERHNNGYIKSTKSYAPWQIIYTEEFGSKSSAYKREIQIKSYKGGNAFKKLLNKK